MGDPIDENKSAESDRGADQTIMDATHETLRREADRLLNLIEEADLLTKAPSQPPPPSAASADRPGENAKPLMPTPAAPAKPEPSSHKAWPLLLTLLGLGVATGFAIRSGVRQGPSNVAIQDRPPAERLAYQASCGSPTTEGSLVWWPVLANYTPELLREVSRDYCGDAYMNTSGDLQVASFTSLQKAQSFAQDLSEATGRSFHVGQKYAPTTANAVTPQDKSITPLSIPGHQQQPAIDPEQSEEGATVAGASKAVESVAALYNALSHKDFESSARWHTVAVAEQFRPDFFSQFSRVSITDLRVSHTDGRQVILHGITRFDYPDNRQQIESRNFTVDLAANPPQVVASEFVKVLKPR